MNTEIFIEDQPTDLTEDISALFTYSISDVKDFSTRDTGFSKTVVFPGTARNNQIFGHAFEFAAFNPYDPAAPNVLANFNAARSAKCRVLVSGIQVFKGVIRLMEVKMLGSFIEYETAIFGELGGLITAIGNKLLTGNVDTAGRASTIDDLDFSAYNQVWNTTNIVQSWADLATLGGGFGLYYPLIDYGLCTTDRIAFSYQALRPALYVHEYIVNIFEKAGYTWECPFFETSFFKSLIVPHNEDKVYKLVRLLIDNRSNTVANFLTTNTAKNINFSNSIALDNFTAAYSTGTTGSVFTYTGPDAVIKVNARVSMEAQGGQSAVQLICELRINAGDPEAVETVTLTGIGGGAGKFQSIDFNLDAAERTFVAGDTVQVNIEAVYPGAAPSNSWLVNMNAVSRITANSRTEVAAPAVYGDTLSINNLIPKGILQKDFLLSIVKMFNLCIIEDPDTDKHLIIEPFIDFFDNSTFSDWTAKVDRSKGISLKPMSEVNARYFNFLYERDNDYDNETYFKRYGRGYADRTFDAGLDFVKDKKDLKIIFASSPLVGVSGLDKVVTRIMKQDSNGAEERISSKIRILQAKRKSVTSWDVLEDDLTTVINSTTFYGYAGHVDDPVFPSGADLNFGAPAEMYWVPTNPYLAPNLFAIYYSPYMAEITDKDSKLLTCQIRLTSVDILNLDFGTSIYIDGQLWRLNRIIDYNAVQEDVTKVELLKVIALSY